MVVRCLALTFGWPLALTANAASEWNLNSKASPKPSPARGEGSLEEERAELVKRLEMLGVIRTPEVRRAALTVPREEFVPEHLRRDAYRDAPLPIGEGQTISAPHGR